MKLIKPCCYLLLAFVLLSCDYKFNEDYYVEIEKPPQEIPVTIYLSDVNEDQNIYIYQSTRIYYHIDAEARPLLSVEVQVDNNYISYGEDENGLYFYLDYPYWDYKPSSTLTMDIQILPNSGSLAEKLGLERYVINKEFIVVYLEQPTIDLKVKQGKSSDGYLQISWENPEVPHAKVDYYTISPNYYDEKKIVYPENPVYIDKEYLYGYKEFIITVYFKNDKLDPHYYYYTVEYQYGEDTKFTYELLENYKLKISWTPNEYRCKYICNFYYDNKIIETVDNSVIIDQFRFPIDNLYFEIYLLSTEKEYDSGDYHIT